MHVSQPDIYFYRISSRSYRIDPGAIINPGHSRNTQTRYKSRYYLYMVRLLGVALFLFAIYFIKNGLSYFDIF